jgi:hypothetical protein
MPKLIKDAAMITTPNGEGVIVIGGYSDGDLLSTFYQLKCNARMCQWLEMQQKLQIARRHFVAMLVPDDITVCNYN